MSPRARKSAAAARSPAIVVWVSGTIGDAGLGLAVLKGDYADLAKTHRAALTRRFQLPEPRTALGPASPGLPMRCSTCRMALSPILATSARPRACRRRCGRQTCLISGGEGGRRRSRAGGGRGRRLRAAVHRAAPCRSGDPPRRERSRRRGDGDRGRRGGRGRAAPRCPGTAHPPRKARLSPRLGVIRACDPYSAPGAC